MKLIDEKYRHLEPSIEYLTDEVVMAQAWKKTHNYIRTFNWYADTLALDISALGIEANARIWADLLREGKPLHPIELVPASKSEAWEINEAKGWGPTQKSLKKREGDADTEGKIPLRPLAHLSIRDQTWSSAAMLCLADIVETAQGDCSHDHDGAEGALSRGVYSYGNRLLCSWKEDLSYSDKAWFRWGNSQTYRGFYIDYQSFLERPITVGRRISEHKAEGEEIFIVNLDLSKFYNTIDREKLIGRLRNLTTRSGRRDDPKFWEVFGRIMDWQWSEKDIALADKHKLGNITQGLPQGLVASGFFANAYLIDFDQKFGQLIGSHFGDGKVVQLHDYCRYVDDLRLVISTKQHDIEKITEQVNRFALSLLHRFGGGELEINGDKTKVTTLADLDNEGGMTKRIKTIQEMLSGPTDRDMLNTVSGMLEGLLTIESDQLPRRTKPSDQALLDIAGHDHDIRPDTLKRFAANRLESIVRAKRQLNLTPDIPNVAMEETGNESELLAKKLIQAWMKDPSLGLVLRKAMEIHPDASLFEPVIEAIYQRTSIVGRGADEHTAASMDFLLADIFRCAADFNGYFQGVIYPVALNPRSIIELITRYAHNAINSGKATVFVKRQALMLCAVVNNPTTEDSPEKLIQHTLFLNRILRGDLPKTYRAQLNALFEIAGQITDDFGMSAIRFLDYVNAHQANTLAAIKPFAMRGGPFWNSLWMLLTSPDAPHPITKAATHADLMKQLDWAKPLPVRSPSGRKQNLAKVIASERNGFEHEAALIKLGLGLIDLLGHGSNVNGSSPSAVMIQPVAPDSLSWDKLYVPSVRHIHCTLAKAAIEDPRFIAPGWLSEKNPDAKGLYWLGSILRSAILGGSDYTGNRWQDGSTVTYKGLRTSWYKRRMGMFHTPEKMVGEYSTVSPWISELLMRCLQWPGFEATYIQQEDIKTVNDLGSLKSCLTARLERLNALYCESSQMPVIPTVVKRPRKESARFRIVTIQQLLPRTSNFSPSDPELNSSTIRNKHQDHLRDICVLTEKTLEAKLKADDDNPKPKADLIVFPEVAVHPNDEWQLKRLADKTQAIVFAGLVFSPRKGVLINKARWFIPHYQDTGRQWIIRDQGKAHITVPEKSMGIKGYRPCQHLIEIHGHPEGPFRMTGAICYDATDIKLAADLRDKADLFIVAAHNKDVNTFDNMAAALQYHMFQHVVITNIGQFGGSTIQAPYKEPYDRLIAHSHGVNQIAINMADIDLAAFTRRTVKVKKKASARKEVKTKPAGMG